MSENNLLVTSKVPTPKYPNGSAFAAQPSGSGRFHWTVETFYRATDAGLFDDAKQWELINGELWRRNDLNPPHSYTGRKIGRLLRHLFEPELLVVEEHPIHLSTDGEPVPDVCVVMERGEEYLTRHPTQDDVRLLIEVADATEAKDTGEKATLYAVAGITDYWVVLINKRQVNVYRHPQNGKYAAPLELKDGDTVLPLAAPGVMIAVTDLLPPAPLADAAASAIQ